MNPLKTINRDEFTPLYAQIADQLVEYIRQKNLQPGAPLPSQNELIRHYGVSTMTIRIAMQRLETDGVIKRIRGKGTFVAEKKIIDAVKGITSLEDRLAEQGHCIVNSYVESYETLPAERIRQDLLLKKGKKAFKIRRLKVLEEVPVAIETIQFPLYVAEKLTLNRLKTEPFVNLLNQYSEFQLSRIRYNTRASLASELEAELMGVEIGYPVLVQYGVFYNLSDTPLMAGRISYLADKIELEYQLVDNDNQEFKVLL